MKQTVDNVIPQLPQRAVIGDRETPFESEIIKYLEQFRKTKPNKEKFHYFWQTVSPFSQWHRCTFTSPVKVWGSDPKLQETTATH